MVEVECDAEAVLRVTEVVKECCCPYHCNFVIAVHVVVVVFLPVCIRDRLYIPPRLRRPETENASPAK